MEKKPFLTESMAQDIIQDVPTPFHVYDEKGIRENARRINKAFSWNKGFREYFAVKALPNPVILQILKEEGCGDRKSTRLNSSHLNEARMPSSA